MTRPLLSVVIPCHNNARYLSQAIQSVLDQNWSPLQIIVIDDGSTDETEQVARSFAQIEYSKQARNGAAAARNSGVEQARGEFLAFLDADDLWTPNKIEKQVAAIETSAHDAPMVFGCVRQFFSDDLDDATRAKTRLSDEIAPAYAPSALLLRRDDFLRVGLFETTWEIGEFMDWYGRAIESGLQAQLLPEVVLRRRVHATNQGMTKRDQQRDYARILKVALDRRRKRDSAENAEVVTRGNDF